MIKPAIGRKVWFYPPAVGSMYNQIDPEQALDATVIYVHSDRMVNLFVVDHRGRTAQATSVPLLQDDDAKPDTGFFATWMPYQKAQAAKEGS